MSEGTADKAGYYVDTFAHLCGHALRFNADLLPERCALKSSTSNITYGQLGDAVHRIYGFFKCNNIGSQDVISFYLRDCWQQMAFQLATVISGSAIFGRGRQARKLFRDFGCSIAICHESDLEFVLNQIKSWKNIKMIIVVEPEDCSDVTDNHQSGIRVVSMGRILQCPPLYDEYEDWNDRNAEEKVFFSPCPYTGAPIQLQTSAKQLKEFQPPQYEYSNDWSRQMDVMPILSPLHTPAGFYRMFSSVVIAATAVLGPFRTIPPLDRQQS